MMPSFVEKLRDQRRKEKLAREYSHPGYGYTPTKEEISQSIDVGLGRVPSDVAYGEQGLQAPAVVGGLVSLDPTDYLSGAGLAKLAAMAKVGGAGLASLAGGMTAMNKLGSQSVPHMFGQSGMIKAGTPFTFVRNTEKSPNLGARFGQDIEPHGRYLLEDTSDFAKNMPPSWESGELTFKNPLMIDWGGEYGSKTNWKNLLSQKFGGKKGKELSKEIKKAGYDGVVTIRDGETSEIVDLTRLDKK